MINCAQKLILYDTMAFVQLHIYLWCYEEVFGKKGNKIECVLKVTFEAGIEPAYGKRVCAVQTIKRGCIFQAAVLPAELL